MTVHDHSPKSRVQPASAKTSSSAELTNIPGVMRASDLFKIKLAANDGPERWIEKINGTVAERLDAHIHFTNPYKMEQESKQIYEDLLKLRPIEREWQPLYQLYVSYGLLNYLTDIAKEQTISQELLERAYASFLFYLVEEAGEAAEEIGIHALPFQFDPYIHFLREDAVSLLSSDRLLFFNQRIDLYRQLWTSLFKREAWRKEERRRLQSLLIEKKNATALSAGYLHQLYLANDLEGFRTAAKRMPAIGIELYVAWMSDSIRLKQPDKARLLVKTIDQHLESYLHQLANEGTMQVRRFVHYFLTHIDTEWLADQEPSLYQSLLEKMLPYSYTDLSLYLLQSHRYEEWAELALWMDSDLAELEREGLKEAAKAAPAEVLPIYHHGIVRLINERNRPGYKKAVRYLKKLRTLYKKLKQLDRWELYLHQLLEEHKRLRAFQEECRKGQLIHA